MRRLIGGLAILLLAACAPEPQPAKPALWRVEGAHGEWGYLFGTIHSLKQPALWRSGKVGPALDEADRIVVEVALLSDQASLRKTFAAMPKTPGLTMQVLAPLGKEISIFLPFLPLVVTLPSISTQR